VGAREKPALWFSKQRWRALSRRRLRHVHAVVELREDAAELHHLTGHYHAEPENVRESRLDQLLDMAGF